LCEFNIIIEGEKVYSDVVYAKDEKKDITVKTILGEIKKFENCRIVEVDVNNAKLVLEKIK
jgi:predicted RNA-binding protein